MTHTIARKTRRVVRRLIRYIWHIYHSLYFPPAVICVAILTLTALGWLSTRHTLQHDLGTAKTTRITSTERLLQSNMGSYEEILRGGVGLLQGSDEVTRADWQHYVSAFDISDKYPSVQVIGFAELVNNDQLPGIVAYMQAQGETSFTVYPAEPARAMYLPVLYVQPERPSNAVGFNMLSEPARQTAALQARDTNSATITSPLSLLAGQHKDDQRGFVLFEPYYGASQSLNTVAGRQAAIRGFVYASFRADVFFKDLVADDQTPTMGLRVSEGESQLYQSGNYASLAKKHGVVKVTRPLRVYGQAWNVQYVFSRSGLASQPQLNRPMAVALVGSFMAVMVPLIVWLLLRARASELVMQKEHDIELAKDELLSLASHQLRTPATGVKQYVGMLLQGFVGEVTAEQQRILEKAYASNDRQLQVINEILHLAKIDAGRIVLARQVTDMRELLADIVHEQQSDITSASHKLITHIPKQPVTLSIDPHIVRMAIENLLSNAIKYTPHGGTITITMRQTARDVHVSIQDTGVGIAEEDFIKLFRQFSRLPNEMSQQVGGTGVGLYLAKHLIELHGGTIRVSSTVGQGTTFSVTFPKGLG
ncbi:MAG TPA: CHASE domain-containing protein [Candidatus Saccharimonadales bacterium]|nr:CHASE domain-containing protein [Candidatus Saccharimonadales bacterium]